VSLGVLGLDGHQARQDRQAFPPWHRHHVLTCPSSTLVGYVGDGNIHRHRATLRRAGHERV
jgi:hypothetical protein